MTQPLCIHVPPLRDPLEVTLPGGMTMRHIELADLIQPALAPLVPLFNIVDCIAALYACSKAVLDALGPPPDPSKLAACIPEVAEKVSKLLGLVPMLSLPLLILVVIWNLTFRPTARSRRVRHEKHLHPRSWHGHE